MSKLLVVGANGFIGSHIVDHAVAHGHEVTAFDRFSSGSYSFDRKSVRIFAGEFLNEADLRAAVTGQDYVLHFLSTTTPASTILEPALDMRTNVLQTIALMDACVKADVKHLYFASTGGAIYGQQGKDTYSETDPAIPISPYGIGKLAIERYLDYFTVTHGLSATSFRISNPYGTRQHPNRKQGLIPIALRKIVNGEPVTRMGDGSMVRDYIFVEDVAEIVMKFVGRQTQESIYNIGSGIGNSVNEVLESLRRVTQVDFAETEIETPTTFVHRSVLNIDRYTSEFGPFDFTSLDDGVRSTYLEAGTRESEL
jgi:UDP-glucose 4-epimerase